MHQIEMAEVQQIDMADMHRIQMHHMHQIVALLGMLVVLDVGDVLDTVAVGLVHVVAFLVDTS